MLRKVEILPDVIPGLAGKFGPARPVAALELALAALTTPLGDRLITMWLDPEAKWRVPGESNPYAALSAWRDRAMGRYWTPDREGEFPSGVGISGMPSIRMNVSSGMGVGMRVTPAEKAQRGNGFNRNGFTLLFTMQLDNVTNAACPFGSEEGTSITNDALLRIGNGQAITRIGSFSSSPDLVSPTSDYAAGIPMNLGLAFSPDLGRAIYRNLVPVAEDTRTGGVLNANQTGLKLGRLAQDVSYTRGQLGRGLILCDDIRRPYYASAIPLLRQFLMTPYGLA